MTQDLEKRKLDLSAAWSGAMRMITSNREMVMVVGGVFFFLPYLIFSLFVPEADAMSTAEGDYDAMMAAVEALYAQFWWALLALMIIQGIGMVAVLAVLGDAGRPTVGSAIARGARLLLPQIAAQFLLVAAILIVATVATVIAALLGSAIGAVMAIVAIPLIALIMVRLSLTGPVIAIEQIANPIAALMRSWRLTGGTTLRLLSFYVLLLLAAVVLSTVLTLTFGLVLALLGESLALIGGAILGSLLNTIFALLAYAVLASILRQLSGGGVSVPRTAVE